MRCTGLSVDLVTMNRQHCANQSTTRDVLSLHHRSSPCFQRPQRAWPMVMVVTTATCATYAVLLQVGHTVFPPWPMLIDETRQWDSSGHGSVFIPKEKEIPPVLVTPRGSCWKTNHMHGQRIPGRAVSRLRKTDPSSNGAHHFLLLHLLPQTRIRQAPRECNSAWRFTPGPIASEHASRGATRHRGRVD